MTKLKSMTAYVLEQIPKDRKDNLLAESEKLKYIFKYAKFLSMPLELKMFVPCVNGEPIIIHNGEEIDDSYPIEIQKAKSEVLFEGFEVKSKTAFNNGYEFVIDKNEIFYPYWNNPVLGWEISKGLRTIEDLVKFNLTLTPQVKEKFNF